MRNQFILTPFFLDQASPELESLAQPDWHINRPPLPEGGQQQRLSSLHRPLARLVAQAVTQGSRPISVAGDCCAAIGVLAGLQQAGLHPALLWLDAHGDFNTRETTPSGFLGGMPLAMLVGRGEQTLVQAVGLSPLSEKRVILFDGRDLDPLEKAALDGSALHHMTNLHTLLEHRLLAQPLYVHLDADVVNPDDAPAMSYRAPGGPSAADLRTGFQALARTGQIVAVSMTTWTPQLDADGQSQTVCMELLRALIGE